LFKGQPRSNQSSSQGAQARPLVVGDGRAEVPHTFGTERRAERTGSGKGKPAQMP
jgi:hypothetical protein